MMQSVKSGATKLVTLATLLLAWSALPAFAQDAAPAKKVKADDYPLTTCPVTGAQLGSMGDPVIKKYDGREVRFCCAGCPAKFEKDLAANLKKLDAAVVKAQLPDYPLETCVVTGEKLGSMGKPVDYVYKGQLVRLCCKSCVKTLEKDPKPHLAKLAEARKAAKSGKVAKADTAVKADNTHCTRNESAPAHCSGCAAH